MITPSLKRLAILLLLLAQISFKTAGQERLHVPFVQRGICPFEGCRYGRWTARSPLLVYSNEGDSTRVLFTIASGDSFVALTGNVHLDQAGLVIVTKRYDPFQIGDTLHTLAYRGEGYIDVWHRGKVQNIEMFWDADDDADFAHIDIRDSTWSKRSGVLIRKPIMVWWVKIINSRGQSGWLRLVNRTINGFHLNEQIDGMDALG